MPPLAYGRKAIALEDAARSAVLKAARVARRVFGLHALILVALGAGMLLPARSQGVNALTTNPVGTAVLISGLVMLLLSQMRASSARGFVLGMDVAVAGLWLSLSSPRNLILLAVGTIVGATAVVATHGLLAATEAAGNRHAQLIAWMRTLCLIGGSAATWAGASNSNLGVAFVGVATTCGVLLLSTGVRGAATESARLTVMGVQGALAVGALAAPLLPLVVIAGGGVVVVTMLITQGVPVVVPEDPLNDLQGTGNWLDPSRLSRYATDGNRPAV